jgi:hypothetical protein
MSGYNPIETMTPMSGRVRKEDGSIINTADIMDSVYDEASESLKVKAELDGGDSQIGAVELKDADSDTRAKVGSEGLHVDSQNRRKEVIFHHEATVPAEVSLPVGAYKSLTLELFGTSTSRTVKFYGVGKSGIKRPLPAVKMTGDVNFDMMTETTLTGCIFELSITGLDYVIVDLTAVAGGNVSAEGSMVA